MNKNGKKYVMVSESDIRNMVKSSVKRIIKEFRFGPDGPGGPGSYGGMPMGGDGLDRDFEENVRKVIQMIVEASANFRDMGINSSKANLVADKLDKTVKELNGILNNDRW